MKEGSTTLQPCPNNNSIRILSHYLFMIFRLHVNQHKFSFCKQACFFSLRHTNCLSSYQNVFPDFKALSIKWSLANFYSSQIDQIYQKKAVKNYFFCKQEIQNFYICLHEKLLEALCNIYPCLNPWFSLGNFYNIP